MKVQVKPNGQAVITVPKAMRNAKGWKESQELEWTLTDKGDLELLEK